MSNTVLRLCLVIALGLLTPMSIAQDSSPAELRREIEELRTAKETLQTENDQLVEQIATLRIEIEALRANLDAAKAQIVELMNRINANPSATPETTETPPAKPTTTPEQPAAAIPADHLASPASLQAALQAAYEARFPNPVLTTEADQKRYEALVRRWARDMNMQLRGPSKWRVMLSEIEVPTPAAGTRPRPTDAAARMMVLDQKTGIPIGQSFLVKIPSRMVNKLSEESTQEYELSLLLLPKPVINSGRMTRGVFEWPPFIGPMVEFGFDFEWNGLRDYRTKNQDEQAESATPQPAPGSDEP